MIHLTRDRSPSTKTWDKVRAWRLQEVRSRGVSSLTRYTYPLRRSPLARRTRPCARPTCPNDASDGAWVCGAGLSVRERRARNPSTCAPRNSFRLFFCPPFRSSPFPDTTRLPSILRRSIRSVCRGEITSRRNHGNHTVGAESVGMQAR